MHYYLFLLTASCLYVTRIAHAFVSPQMKPAFLSCSDGISSFKNSAPRGRRRTSVSMESDFASAMPEKPQMSLEDRLVKSAGEFVDNVRGNLGEGVDEPPELIALEKAYKEDKIDTESLAIRIYELMIEAGMLYDRDPDTGTMTPTGFSDLKNMLDVPEVKAEFQYLYQYGMNLISTGVATVDSIKEVVKERLIERTGLTPEKFDEWLGY